MDIEKHFRLPATQGSSFPQFSVLYIKSQDEQFDDNSLPAWKEEDWKTVKFFKVFEAEKYIIAKPTNKKGHAEKTILENQAQDVYNLIDKINGKVDLMLFTVNSPCCLKSPDGESPKTRIDKRKEVMKSNGNKYLPCDEGSCTKFIANFISKFEGDPLKKNKEIRIHLSWRQPYIAQKEFKDKESGEIILQPNDPMYYRTYFESLIDFINSNRVRLWLLEKPWGTLWFQKSLAEHVIEKKGYRKDKNVNGGDVKPLYIEINYVTSFCVRYGLDYLKNKPVDKFYPFADEACWDEALNLLAKNDKLPYQAEIGAIKNIVMDWVKSPDTRQKLEEKKLILGPPLNIFQGLHDNDVDDDRSVALYSPDGKVLVNELFPEDKN